MMKYQLEIWFDSNKEEPADILDVEYNDDLLYLFQDDLLLEHYLEENFYPYPLNVQGCTFKIVCIEEDEEDEE